MMKIIFLFYLNLLLFTCIIRVTEENISLHDPPEGQVQQVVDIVNGERTKAGLHPLLTDSALMVAATIRVEELVAKFSHERPDGEPFYTVIPFPYRSAGENIAYGQFTAENVMKDWMNSKGHRRNILSSDFTHIGVGRYE